MMLIIRVRPDPAIPLLVVEVIELLKGVCDVQITSTDSFAAERAKVISAAQDLEREGPPLKHLSLVLESIRNKELAFGPGMNLTLDLGDRLILDGHVWAKDILFRSRSAATVSQVRPLIAALEQAALGPVEIKEVS